MFYLPGCTTSTQNKNPNWLLLFVSKLFGGRPRMQQHNFRFAGNRRTSTIGTSKKSLVNWRLAEDITPVFGYLEEPHPGGFFRDQNTNWIWASSILPSCRVHLGKKLQKKSSSTKIMGGGRTKKIDSGLCILEKLTWFTGKSPLGISENHRNQTFFSSLGFHVKFPKGTSYLVHHCVVFNLNLLIAQWSHRHINNRIFAVICLKTQGWKTPVLSPSIRAKVYWVYFLLYHIFPTLIYADVPMHRSEGNNIHITITILG